MADMLSRLPEELRKQILGNVDNHTLTQIALVSRILNYDATDILYRDIDSPWPLIQLLGIRWEGSVMEGFTLETPIPHDKLKRFSEKAELVIRFSWTENIRMMCSECCAVASVHIYDTIVGDILPHLQWLRTSCLTLHGVRAVMPWLSRSLEKLELAFGPEVDDLTVVSCLLRVRQACTVVASFTFTLDSSHFQERRDGVIDALIDAVSVMPKLRKVSLPLDLITRPILDALATLSDLHTLILTQATAPVVWNTAYTPSVLLANSDSGDSDSDDDTPDFELDELSPLNHLQDLPSVSSSSIPIPPHIETSRFHALHNLRTTARTWTEVATIVQSMHPGLRHLSVAIPAGQSAQERLAAMEDIRNHCPGVEIVESV